MVHSRRVHRLVRLETFPVHSFEVDAFGLLSPPALAGYLQEAAGNHAVEMGCGADALARQGLAWVLREQRIEMELPVKRGEVLTVETWPSGSDRLLALRDFRVRRGDGRPVARAATRWLVMSLETRRPVRLERVLEERLRAPAERVFAGPEPLLPEVARADGERRLDVRYQDIDRNLHVTNASYLAWALEALPEGAWREERLVAAHSRFLAEARHGGAVISRLARLGPREYAHAILRDEDGEELCRLRTAWAPRDV